MLLTAASDTRLATNVPVGPPDLPPVTTATVASSHHFLSGIADAFFLHVDVKGGISMHGVALHVLKLLQHVTSRQKPDAALTLVIQDLI